MHRFAGAVWCQLRDGTMYLNALNTKKTGDTTPVVYAGQ